MTTPRHIRQAVFGAGASAMAATAFAAAVPDYGPNLERFEYPHEVRRFSLDTQGQKLEMAYMDVAPARPNGRTVVLMHGKNFCGATWEGTIEALTGEGYRVVAPDQIGFCKSDKPASYQFTFHQLAANTHALLEHLDVRHAVVMGHSMGGMLATRYALMYAKETDALVLVNPIGLEDWKQRGVPYRTVDQWYASEQKTGFDGMKKYQKGTYYAGQWRPEYDRWVLMAAGMLQDPQARKRVAWNQALTYDMIYTQPVVHEFRDIAVPTTLLIGERDNTAPGKDAAPPEVAKRLGNYARLGPEAARAIPGARLVAFPEMGHSPQIQDPKRFHEALIESLDDMASRGRR
ncbi:3-oxoadipate enol-lactone hydrolase [Bordetella ansorpii]|uniref:3-oxoadipate enol-lactone hydrolase n=1 Tax=Bordetella ansorpii TaxID=288768 RepID=A0A157SGF6_9BORD|nr:alpha/beta hydrolase [Bordetella ansorpii]SAI69515.1 3-oxoadipate enol-lactone hydrolase [Bordetella ansorpii]